MATQIKVVSGLLVINDKFGVRTDGFGLSTSKDGVKITSVHDGIEYWVKTKEAEVDGQKFTSAKDLFLAIAALSTAGGGGGGPTTVTSDDITDATNVGKSLLTAEDAVSARTAIGAGTSDLVIGTTASTAKAGNYTPPNVTTSANGLMLAADKLKLDGIAEGATDLVIGTTATTAAAGNHTHSNYVPTSRTVNTKPLSANIVLNGADVAITGYAIGTEAALAAADTLNEALGKLEARIVALETP